MTKFCRYGAFEKERLSDKVSVVTSDFWITVPFQTQCSKSFIRWSGLFGNLHTIDEGQSLNSQLLLLLGTWHIAKKLPRSGLVQHLVP